MIYGCKPIHIPSILENTHENLNRKSIKIYIFLHVDKIIKLFKNKFFLYIFIYSAV